MSYTTRVPIGTRFLLKATLGNKNTREFLATLTKWQECSGTEWTCKRFKALLAAAKQLRAGNRTAVKTIYQTESIAYKKGTLYPKNRVISIIFNTIQTAQNPSVLKRHFGILRIGTMFILPEITAKQVSKSVETIEQKPKWDQSLIDLLVPQLERRAERVFGDQSDNIKPIDMQRLKAFTATYRGIGECAQTLELPYGKLIKSLVSTCKVPTSLREEIPDEIREFLALIAQGNADSMWNGKLAFLNEKGCKCRTIAVPNGWVQLLMEPLHQRLDTLAKQSESSVLHDQNKGAYFLAHHLPKGVWCYDLSSATDLFPLPLQKAVLRGLNLPQYADALDELVGYYQTTNRIDSWMRTVHYRSGQPMGMYGSFPLFHLTHILLLEIIGEMVFGSEQRRLENFFKVLGDDVIITDQSAARRYSLIMKGLAVPISPSKSITSSEVGEFAGFLGVKTRESVAMFRPYKHRPDDRGGYMNLINALGSKCRNLPRKWGVWYDMYKHTLSWRNPDLSPLISEDMSAGNLPDKINREKLYSLFFRCFEEDPDLYRYLTVNYGEVGENRYISNLVEKVCEVLLYKQHSNKFDQGLPEEPTRPVKLNNPASELYLDPLMREEQARRREDASSPKTNEFGFKFSNSD